MKKLLCLFFATLCITSYARVDIKCLVSYTYNRSDGVPGLYTNTTSDDMEVTVSFLSGAEFRDRKPATEKYAIVWFSQENCAVILLEPKRTTYDLELTFEDMYDVVSAGLVFGEQVNGGSLDDMGFPYRWNISLRDPKRGYDFVDPRLRDYNNRTGYSLYAL